MTAEIKEKLPEIYSRELTDLLFYEFPTKIQQYHMVHQGLYHLIHLKLDVSKL